jgi:hypothetical protein
MNYRGQLLSFVNNSVLIGEEREKDFTEYLKNKNVIILKKNKYKPYDFTIKDHKNIKLELKTINNSWGDYEYIYICVDKLIYYQYRLNKDPELSFILIYAFYGTKDNPNEKIIYRYTTVNIYEYLYIYERKYHENKKCVLIPFKLFRPLKPLIATIKGLKSTDTPIDFIRFLHYNETLNDLKNVNLHIQ